MPMTRPWRCWPKAFGRKHVGANGLDHRHQVCRTGANPVGQRRDHKLDAFARISRALAVERQVQAILGEQHVREQHRSGPPARDRRGEHAKAPTIDYTFNPGSDADEPNPHKPLSHKRAIKLAGRSAYRKERKRLRKYTPADAVVLISRYALLRAAGPQTMALTCAS
jgi:hypothetical protein